MASNMDALEAARLAPKGERLDPIEKARANPRSRSLAIRAKCWDCQGAGQDPGTLVRVRECPITACPLWNVRPYQTSDDEG